MAETGLNIRLAVEGAQRAVTDLAQVDAELNRAGSAASSGAAGFDRLGNAVNSVEGNLSRVNASANRAGASLSQAASAASRAERGLGSAGKAAQQAANSFGSISKFASSAHLARITDMFRNTGVAVNTTSRQVQDLTASLQRVARENAFKQLASEANLSATQLARLRAGMGDYSGALRSLGQASLAAKTGIAALAVGFVAFQKSALDSAMALQRVRQAYATIFGSGADAQLKMVYEQSKAVGQQFMANAEAAKTFFAAASDTSIAPQMNEIYKAVSNAGAAMQLSGEQMQGVFLALGQMVSKGKVQAEELRGQLGERLPGAFQMAARAMGMTTAELDKFMADGKLTAEDLLPKLADVLQEKFAGAAENAANTVQGSLNNMLTEWEQFKANLAASGPATFLFNAVANFMGNINAHMATNRENDRIDAILRERGVAPAGTREAEGTASWGLSAAEAVYTEDQRNEIRKEEARAAAMKRRRDAAAKAESDQLAKSRSAIDNALKNTSYGKRQKLDEQNAAAMSAFDTMMAEYSRPGAFKSDKEQQQALAALAAQRAAVNKKYQDDLKALENAGNKGAGAATRAANAQGDYNTELRTTQDHVAALQAQLGLDKTEYLTSQKISIEQKYQEALDETNNKIDKQVRSGAISAAQGEALKAEKEKENSLEKQLALREAEDKANEKELRHLQEQLGFYDDLAQLSGNYTSSVSLQNRLIEKQADKYRKIKDIPAEMVDEWERLKKLQASTDWFDGVTRGLMRFNAEYSNAAKQWEDISYNFAKSFEQNVHDMFDEFIDTGKISFDSMAQMFKNLLKQMAYQALIQPIVLSVVNGVAGAMGSGGSAQQGQTATASTSDVGGLVNLAGGMATKYLFNKTIGEAGSTIVSGITNTINTSMASWFPNAFASSASEAAINQGLNYAASQASGAYTGYVGGATSGGLPTQTATGALGSLPTMGAGLAGSLLANYLIVPALGIKTNTTGAQIGGMVGGAAGTALGAWGGGVLGSTLAGASGGSIGGPIGAAIGAIVGTIAGLLTGGAFGGGYEQEPGLRFDTFVDLMREEDLPYLYSASRERREGAGYELSGQRWDGMPKSAMVEGVAALDEELQGLFDVLEQTKGVVASIGNDSLNTAFTESLRRNRYWESHAYWEDEDVTFDEYAKEFQASFVSQIIRALGDTDMSGIANAADGMVADTEDEISMALTEAIQFISIGESLAAAIEDENVKTEFENAIAGSLIASLSRIDTDAIGLTVDKTSLTGWGVAAQAMQYRSEVNAAIDELIDPTSELAAALRGIGTQFAEWTLQMDQLGWQESQLQKIEDRRIEYIKKYTDDVLKSLKPLDNFTNSMKEVRDQLDDLVAGLRELGMSEEYIVQIERERISILQDTAFEQTRSMEQSLAMRVMSLQYGSDSDIYGIRQLQYQQENELYDARDKYGEYSGVYSTLVRVQQAELLKQRMNQLEEQLQTSLSSEINAAKTLQSTFKSIVKTLKDIRRELWTSDENLMGTRYQDAYAKFNETYLKAIAGDVEALEQLPGLATTVLDLGKEQLQTRDEYNSAFYDIDQKLKDAQKYAADQLSTADAQVDLYESMLAQMQGSVSTFSGGVEEIIAELLKLKDAWLEAMSGLQDTVQEGFASVTLAQENALIQAKVNQLNATKEGGRSDWTAKDFLDAVYGQDMTLQTWYDRYGQYEGLGVEYDTAQAWQNVIDSKLAQLNATKEGGKNDWTEADFLNAVSDAGMSLPEWYLKYGISEGISSSYVSNSDTTWDYAKLLSDKAAALNNEKYLGRDNWTVQGVAEAIAQANMSVQEWYEKYGRTEGFVLTGVKQTNASLDKQTQNLLQSLGVLSSTTGSGLSSVVETVNSGTTATTQGLVSMTSALQAYLSAVASVKGGSTSASTSSGGSAASGSSSVSGGSSSGGSVTGTTTTVTKTPAGIATGIYGSKYATEQALLSAKLAKTPLTNDITRDIILHYYDSIESWARDNAQKEGLGGSGLYGTNFNSENAILSAKTALLKKEGCWNTTNLKNYMEMVGLTVKEWYERHGKAEGFATGGITPVNEPFWVGEHGKELVMSQQSYRVMDHSSSLAFAQEYRGDVQDGDRLAPILREIYQVLRQELQDSAAMRSYLERIKRLLNKWESQEGLKDTASANDENAAAAA